MDGPNDKGRKFKQVHNLDGPHKDKILKKKKKKKKTKKQKKVYKVDGHH